MATKIIGIRFQKIGKIYHFDATRSPEVKIDDFVIVETSRGKQIGRVVVKLDKSRKTKGENIKPILRKATPRDLLVRQLWQRKEEEALLQCREKAREYKILGVKFVATEFTYDGKRLTIFFSSEGEEKVDLKRFHKAIARMYPKQRVELKQIGPRDVAKIIGGLGACGIAERCCSRFLTEFNPISIKMAKTQGISLAPSEITGMCGRLRCCLLYEHEQYAAIKARMPKKGKRVITPLGEGKVIGMRMLSEMVVVELENAGQKVFHLDEIKIK